MHAGARAHALSLQCCHTTVTRALTARRRCVGRGRGPDLPQQCMSAGCVVGVTYVEVVSSAGAGGCQQHHWEWCMWPARCPVLTPSRLVVVWMSFKVVIQLQSRVSTRCRRTFPLLPPRPVPLSIVMSAHRPIRPLAHTSHSHAHALPTPRPCNRTASLSPSLPRAVRALPPS